MTTVMNSVVTALLGSVVVARNSCMAGAGIGTGTGIDAGVVVEDGVGASVAVSDSKAAIGSEFGVWATGVEVSTTDGDGVGMEVGAGVGIRAEVGTGAEVGIKIDAGVVTGVVESKIAGVMTMTGWTLDWVKTGVRNTVP
jgi:hypothetical protein